MAKHMVGKCFNTHVKDWLMEEPGRVAAYLIAAAEQFAEDGDRDFLEMNITRVLEIHKNVALLDASIESIRQGNTFTRPLTKD